MAINITAERRALVRKARKRHQAERLAAAHEDINCPIGAAAEACLSTASLLQRAARTLNSLPEPVSLPPEAAADPLARGIARFLHTAPGGMYAGSAAGLLQQLERVALPEERESPFWPRTAVSLGARLRRSSQLLRAAGIAVHKRKSGRRVIFIERLDRAGSGTSQTISNRKD